MLSVSPGIHLIEKSLGLAAATASRVGLLPRSHDGSNYKRERRSVALINAGRIFFKERDCADFTGDSDLLEQGALLAYPAPSILLPSSCGDAR